MMFNANNVVKKAGAFIALTLVLCTAVSAYAAEDGGELVIPVHRSELVALPVDLSEVIIADPDIADVFVHGSNKVSVVGKTVGITNMRVLDKKHDVLRTLNVRVTYDIPAIRQALYQFFPYEDIAVQTVNNNLALTGMVSSNAVAAQAVRIANEFLITSDKAPRPRGSSFAGSDKVMQGDVGVINMLKVTSGQQVMLRVRVGEMQRTALKELGVNWSALENGVMSVATGTAVGGLGVAGPAWLLDKDGIPVKVGAGYIPLQNANTLKPASGSFGSFTHSGRIGNTDVSGAIDALEQNGLFKLLAEPNLVAMSGEEAEFLAGGEFPIPIAQDNNTITVQFKQFGVSVKFLPQVLSDSRIRIAVSPEISELSEVGSVDIGNGLKIPGISTRRAKTTVELAPGEGFMIAGLMRDQSDSTIKQFPGLGELPILGSLFRSTQFQHNETELVIAVTPYLVDPLSGDEIRLPTDNFRQPSMMEQFFYGALGSLSNDSLRVSQRPSLEGPIGFMVD